MSELQYNDPRQTLYAISFYFKTESLCSLLSYLCNKEKSDEVFFYHPDHLGGAAWITDMSGKPLQYLHYAPYGELVANQMPYGIDERFKFTGKERDAETGYDNHDARYRWSISGDWLSVDPLVDKYIDTQPYLYCNGNPIIYKDFDGLNAKLIIKGNIIIIRADYYVQKKDLNSVTKAVQFWNNQQNLTYIDKDGITYFVRFDLRVKLSSDRPEHDAVLSSNDYSNSYEVVPELGKDINGNEISGQTFRNYRIRVKKSYKETLTGAHEVGHSLMNCLNGNASEHDSEGVMKQGRKNDKDGYVTQDIVNNIVESNGFEQKNQSLWEKIISLFN